MSTGIRQRNSLGPVLFNLIMFRIVVSDSVRGMGKYRMENYSFNILHCTDDTILISSNGTNLQRILHTFNITVRKCNMSMAI